MTKHKIKTLNVLAGLLMTQLIKHNSNQIHLHIHDLHCHTLVIQTIYTSDSNQVVKVQKSELSFKQLENLPKSPFIPGLTVLPSKPKDFTLIYPLQNYIS